VLSHVRLPAVSVAGHEYVSPHWPFPCLSATSQRLIAGTHGRQVDQANSRWRAMSRL
jgi:hypothetical protein